MCRWVLYYGTPILVEDLLVRSVNSLIHQSISKSYTPGINNPLRNHEINGDGFGLCWYESTVQLQFKLHRNSAPATQHARLHSVDVRNLNRVEEAKDESEVEKQEHDKLPTHGLYPPLLYRSLEPAWNDPNLREIAKGIVAPIIMAHVRAAVPGTIVSRENCHPFRFGTLSFMHNGDVGEIARLVPILSVLIPDKYLRKVVGTTDTELAFALFLSMLPREPTEVNTDLYTTREMVETLKELIHALCWLGDYVAEKAGVAPRLSSLNFAVTNGATVVASRFRNCRDEKDEPPSLYYAASHGQRLQLDEETRQLKVSASPASYFLSIASEPLTTNDEVKWNLLPANHVVFNTHSEDPTVPSSPSIEPVGDCSGPPATLPMLQETLRSMEKTAEPAASWRAKTRELVSSRGDDE